MRRKDRERLDQDFFELVFARAEELFLALNDGEFPYCIPANFASVGNNLYIHSAHEGKKLDLIQKNSHVGFAMATDVEIIPEKATTHYKSLCGRGIASIVSDEEEKRVVLDAITIKYHANCPLPSPKSVLDRVTIIKIAILEVTGKNCV